MPDIRFIVSLLTARREYDVARVLYNNGLLDSLFTDLYYAPNQPIENLLKIVLPQRVRKVLNKYQSPIPKIKVHYDLPLGIEFRYKLSKNKRGDYYKAQIDAYKKLNKRVIKYAEKSDSKDKLAFFGFDTACLELFEWGAYNQSHLVMEQCVAPRKTQIKMHQYFASVSKDSCQKMIEHCLHLQEREEKEWELADTIVAPSSFVKDKLIEAGAPQEKITVIPFGYNPTHLQKEAENCIETRFRSDKEKIKILFAGNAGQRKGIYDLFSIAEDMKAENVHFLIAGAIEENCQNYLNSIKLDNVSFLGKLSQADLHEEYRKADIFFFPSYLEGSAMVLLEAMSWGVPVVTTYESGSVIQHKHDGFICSAGDKKDMKYWLSKLINDLGLRYEISKNALYTSAKYTLEQYSDQLVNKLTNVKQSSYA
ncbi:glycosyltransferase family 4 protein [Catalinimonas sp. 4WD22]|uniref:glycosyltransferase family 4 protein n=1 Tax=Catalinimonas locisalis TaxID=3133978 RepID=UPI0031018816